MKMGSVRGVLPPSAYGRRWRVCVYAGGGLCHRAHPKGTARSPQEYVHPLLMLTGEAYANMTLTTCIRTSAMRCAVTNHGCCSILAPGGRIQILFEDGTAKDIDV